MKTGDEYGGKEMSMITEQVKRLREIAMDGDLVAPKIAKEIVAAADTIEQLSEKFRAANMGRSRSGVGYRIKEVLREKRLSIKALSELSGVSLNTLYSITKRDSIRVDKVILVKLADALGMKWYEFYQGEDILVGTIGERIQLSRKRAGLTQAELAERCGVSTITIRQYENNKRTPNVNKVKTIASTLGVKWYELYHEAEQSKGMSKLKQTRKAAGLTQMELAAKVGLSRVTISKYESGDIEMSVKQAAKIAAVLGVKWYELYHEEEAATEHERGESRG